MSKPWRSEVSVSRVSLYRQSKVNEPQSATSRHRWPSSEVWSGAVCVSRTWSSDPELHFGKEGGRFLSRRTAAPLGPPAIQPPHGGACRVKARWESMKEPALGFSHLGRHCSLW